MSDLKALENWVGPLLDRLSDSERRKLAVTVAKSLRASSVASMRAQKSPDGDPWTPRKQPKRNLRGAIRSAAQERKAGMQMFTGLRSAGHLKAQGSASEAVVGFVARVQRIARVHHFGLPDRVNVGGPVYQYPVRELLGITAPQIEHVRDLIIAHLGR
ncbi:phage virion morphogenesis protein [Verminephrobacter aporrectodeae subsp. tuberculatae]|uniref:phage virion morphogenesis protein n=1 Tax=Verminephrobacter aporrectodeae TaxID=1110389 RepID=UPI002244F480|nr:phage virion morphogenesis protein [Verminephrobacter aporrectodeae]MCW8199299.1 phage virion morphogenesis protein [Verminephrobacter aporrectodeae subsp. tuberculatae]